VVGLLRLRSALEPRVGDGLSTLDLAGAGLWFLDLTTAGLTPRDLGGLAEERGLAPLDRERPRAEGLGLDVREHGLLPEM